MGSRWASLLVLMHFVGLSGAATAQTLDEQPWTASNASNPDLMISCTAVIKLGHETQQNLAVAFRKRGNAYYDKGQLDRAIQDFDEAIRLNSGPRPGHPAQPELRLRLARQGGRQATTLWRSTPRVPSPSDFNH
jgi:tetratricopeptide (TPR) repeat protein